MGERIDREELRLLIREALREALGDSPSPVRGTAREGGQNGARHPSSSRAPARKGEGEAYRKDTGVLTEATVVVAGKAHTRIIIGNEVAVTPLARDRARELKIDIVRQKP
jgi:hypothetical protein